MSPLGKVTGTVEPIVQPVLRGVLGRDGDAVGAERVEVALDRAEHEHLVDGRGVEGVERIRRRPSTIAGLIRAWVTTSTPGVARSSSARSGLSPDELSIAPASTMCVPVKSDSSEPAIEVFADAANTVMNPTSATPIISDDAVRAVRFGLRMALRVASSPLSPRIRSGRPKHSSDRAGEHRAEDRHADERRQRTETDERAARHRDRRAVQPRRRR